MTEKEMNAEYLSEAAKNIDFTFVPAKLYKPGMLGKYIDELTYKQHVDCPPDDARAFGYNVGMTHAHFRQSPSTGKLQLVITFEECTFEGYLHPDSKVVIDMETDANTRFHLTFDPKKGRLVLDRVKPHIMTVGELVEDLKKYPNDMPVYLQEYIGKFNCRTIPVTKTYKCHPIVEPDMVVISQD